MVCNDVFCINLVGPIYGYGPVFNLTQINLMDFLHLLKKKKKAKSFKREFLEKVKNFTRLYGLHKN
jgi:hypothetical protein